MEKIFTSKRPLSNTALNVLKRRYFSEGESKWEHVVKRVVDYVIGDEDLTGERYQLTYDMMAARMFIPNSPCLVNAGKNNGGLAACFVVDFRDSIVDIYKTKLDFALVAKKGGGCGTTLSKLRPENSKVEGSTHGYAGGPIKFANTISNDMKAMTQSGFREMAMMMTMSVYHPDILKFIHAKENEEDKQIENSNMSVVVDDKFMKAVESDDTYQTYFDFESGRVYYDTYRAKDIFDLIIEGAWRNGEPGLLFYDTINNNTPYKYSGQIIQATNPCGVQ